MLQGTLVYRLLVLITTTSGLLFIVELHPCTVEKMDLRFEKEFNAIPFLSDKDDKQQLWLFSGTILTMQWKVEKE